MEQQQEAAAAQPKATTAPAGRQLALRSTFSTLAAFASSRALARAPTMEEGVKFSGGVVAALLAMRYAGSLRSACMLGLLSGLFAHSLYADVLRKKRRRRGDKRSKEEELEEEADEEEEKKEEEEEDAADSSS
ncbi:hypothetical protein PF005_g11503 [Phytophthora fragariae]|uniref:Uncharacterized protein n=2 Tax=Phytophthora TaxID=4783 RepID=A0A6A3TZM7_9STRA|nr:hypothetical protein PF009_g12361 [Phytophthora fragariae]KAE9024289.1 hypothetical protein PR002_g11489 [Phytophthora rubi]KAE9009882.1 hypothetical protein PF011_g10064 [Phytophthora fragariae]KAE9029964.1 hypothetical protein PR001_g11381 [Phytophthora rubi]KAE9110781.1 hypothetical protein PF010_g11048 [Phytophthora fragariae]